MTKLSIRQDLMREWLSGIKADLVITGGNHRLNGEAAQRQKKAYMDLFIDAQICANQLDGVMDVEAQLVKLHLI